MLNIIDKPCWICRYWTMHRKTETMVCVLPSDEMCPYFKYFLKEEK